MSFFSFTICLSTKNNNKNREVGLVALVDFLLVDAKGVNETLMLFMTQENPFILYKTSKTKTKTKTRAPNQQRRSLVIEKKEV
jgi:hypothetical protein